MIFTSHFNYFNNIYREKNIINFKKNYNNAFIIGIDSHVADLNFSTKDKIFLKENLLNLGIQNKLDEIKYIFWVDNDVIFEDNNWMEKAIQLFDNGFDVIQLFNICYHKHKDNSEKKPVAGFVYAKQKFNNHGHCGFAWGMRASVYKDIGGLYEHNIIGTGDGVMARSFIQEEIPFFSKTKKFDKKFAYFPFSQGHCDSIQSYYNKCKDIKVGYLEGRVYHDYHGELEKRQYIDRYKIYEKNNYDPLTMLQKHNGIIQIKKEYIELKNHIEQFLRYKDSI
jgi:hypothetical protein